MEISDDKLKERMTRWRLILGQESEEGFDRMNGGESLGLTEEQWLMDQALACIYNNTSQGGFGP